MYMICILNACKSKEQCGKQQKFLNTNILDQIIRHFIFKHFPLLIRIKLSTETMLRCTKFIFKYQRQNIYLNFSYSFYVLENCIFLHIVNIVTSCYA